MNTQVLCACYNFYNSTGGKKAQEAVVLGSRIQLPLRLFFLRQVSSPYDCKERLLIRWALSAGISEATIWWAGLSCPARLLPCPLKGQNGIYAQLYSNDRNAKLVADFSFSWHGILLFYLFLKHSSARLSEDCLGWVEGWRQEIASTYLYTTAACWKAHMQLQAAKQDICKEKLGLNPYVSRFS